MEKDHPLKVESSLELFCQIRTNFTCSVSVNVLSRDSMYVVMKAEPRNSDPEHVIEPEIVAGRSWFILSLAFRIPWRLALASVLGEGCLEQLLRSFRVLNYMVGHSVHNPGHLWRKNS